jgi:hypothetical protein
MHRGGRQRFVSTNSARAAQKQEERLLYDVNMFTQHIKGVDNNLWH